MPRRRIGTKNPELARQSIVDAAMARFSKKGYRGTRIADVAKDAGYSEALVYFHFGSKADLFKEVVSRIDSESSWFTPGATAKELAHQMREGELRYHHDARWRALDHVWSEALAGEPDLLRLMKPQLEGTLDALEELLASYDQVDHPRRRSLASLLMAVSYGYRVLRRYDPDAVSPEDAAEMLGFATELVVHALEGHGPKITVHADALAARADAAEA